MLAAMGLDENDLECGPHWPISERAARELCAEGHEPRRIHNNCSGKHAGLLAVATFLNIPIRGYVDIDHPVQRAACDAVAQLTGTKPDTSYCATDGCSMPTCAVPLTALARAFAIFATGEGLSPSRGTAIARLRSAAAASPFMIGGTGRFDTEVMTALGEQVFLKTGAEGVYVASLPERGVGIAVKADDGAGRAGEAIVGALILALLARDDPAREDMARLAARPVRSWAGEAVGEIRAVLPTRL
jgi:L-asparaginase II